MSSRVTTLVVGMFLTGCANSLLSKYQDMQCVEGCGPGEKRLDFEQPVWQTLNMFIGEFLCCLPLLWSQLSRTHKDGQRSAPARLLAALGLRSDDGSRYRRVSVDDEVENQGVTDEEDTDEEAFRSREEKLEGWRMMWMWFPAFFDICGTTLMNVGLILTPVSIYQMSRGALVLWVGVLSVIFLRRHLWFYQWISLVIVTTGVCLVGLSGSLVKKTLNEGPIEGLVRIATSDDDPAKVALGVILILFAQNFTACQYVVEEKIMSRYKVEPLAAVTLEGFFGLITTLVAMPFLHLFFRDRSPYFDMPRGWHQIVSNSTVMWLSFAICISIGSFNYFGLSVTSRVSATTRSTIDTCRTLGIWIVSLGLGWERLVWPFTLLQVAGFAMLVYGTFVFNGLLPPLCCAPPPAIRLPNEPELEETAVVPAAGAQARAGYDIVPDEDESPR